MWRDSDYNEVFGNFSPTPPETVWHNIAMNLATANPTFIQNRSPVQNGLNKAQKFTLIAASIASILFTGFLMNFIEDSPKLTYAEPKINSIVPKADPKSLIANSVDFNKSSSSIQTIHQSNLTQKEFHKKIIANLPKEVLPYSKDILELVDLDREIAQLAEEIKKDEFNISLAVSNSKLESFNPSKLEWENSKLLSTYHSFNDEPKNESETASSKIFLAQLFSKMYVTPFFGTNYTQVSYQGSTNSPFFSENASFNGKLGYNFGIQTGYQFNKTWSLESGISFGQYLQSFSENLNNNTKIRNGVMYIDQLDIPLMARYSIPFGSEQKPWTLSFKAGLIYNSVIQYQVNYADHDLFALKSDNNNVDADKRLYNSLQLGYIGGFDLEAFISRKISLNISLMNSFVSQLENFPTFSNDRRKPLQNSTIFTFGTKFKF